MQAQAQEKPSREPVIMVVLSRTMDDELRHRLIGQVLRRIREFAGKYDTDGVPSVVARDVEWDSAKDIKDQQYLVILAVRDLQVIGHLLCRIVNYYGNNYVYMQQFEIDEGSGITLEQERQAFRAVLAWKNQIGAVGIRAIAPSPAHRRRLSMMHGFVAKHTTMTFGADAPVGVEVSVG